MNEAIRIKSEYARFYCISKAARTLHKEQSYAGSPVYCGYRDFLPREPRLRPGVRKTMTPWELSLGLLMAIGLTTYLVYAMLRPEKF
jgi:K+-transporting ATPase KdpF subunit